MDLIAEAVCNAWDVHKDRILSTPGELDRRLNRRSQAVCTDNPRAWCLAIAANDKRVDRHWDHVEPPGALRERVAHDVRITSRLFRLLCKPVYIPRPTQDVVDVARSLGCTTHRLMNARHRGQFHVHYYPGLAGKRGKPIPCIYTAEPLDPACFTFRYPDVVWGTHTRWLAEHVPEGIETRVRRVPVLHTTPKDRSIQRFNHWRWECPECRRLVRVMFYPLIQFEARILLDSEVRPEGAPAPPRPPGKVACEKCNHVRHFSRLKEESWIFLVAQYSNGLLYGREVPKPQWYVEKTKRCRPYVPQINRRAKMREEVFERIMRGECFDTIAREMHIPRRRVPWFCHHVYKQHGVHSLEELLRSQGRAPAGNFPKRAAERNHR